MLIISLIIDILSLLCLVLLSANRSRTLVAAAFAFCLISVAQIPSVYFVAFVVFPIIYMPTIYEAGAQFPQLFYSGLFFNNIIITVCCLFAGRWLRKINTKPPLKICVSFSSLFVLSAMIIIFWLSSITEITLMPFFLTVALLGILFLGILLSLFYLCTRLVIKTDSPLVINNSKVNEYTKFVNQLSKREMEVVEAILCGNDSHKKLSSSLNISINTVKTHLKHIYQTTGVSGITALSGLFRGYVPDHPQITPKSPL